MCNFPTVLGEGSILYLQLLTIASIAASIVFWVGLYVKSGLRNKLRAYTLPIVFWVIFGTLDIVITAKGAFYSPGNEGNPFARFIFMETGYPGPIIASVLWIAFWAGLVLAMNKMKIPDFFSLAVFYSLAVGHLYGFSTWFIPFCGFSERFLMILPTVPWLLKAIVVGCFIAALHDSTVGEMERKARRR